MSSRPEFLTTPGAWVRSRRIDQTPAEYASAVEHYQHKGMRELIEGGIWAVVCIAGSAFIGWLIYLGL